MTLREYLLKYGWCQDAVSDACDAFSPEDDDWGSSVRKAVSWLDDPEDDEHEYVEELIDCVEEYIAAESSQ